MGIASSIHNCPITFVPSPGMTDHEIMFNILTINSIDFTPNDIRNLLLLLDQDYYESRVSISPLPGIVDCLQLVNELGGVHGIQTGNTRARAIRKLQNADILDYFRLKYFFTGEDSINRNSILGPTDSVFTQFKKVIIVGDSKLDLDLGEALGVETLGVATGMISLPELLEIGFPFAFQDATKLLIYLEENLRFLG